MGNYSKRAGPEGGLRLLRKNVRVGSGHSSCPEMAPGGSAQDVKTYFRSFWNLENSGQLQEHSVFINEFITGAKGWLLKICSSEK